MIRTKENIKKACSKERAFLALTIVKAGWEHWGLLGKEGFLDRVVKQARLRVAGLWAVAAGPNIVLWIRPTAVCLIQRDYDHCILTEHYMCLQIRYEY